MMTVQERGFAFSVSTEKPHPFTAFDLEVGAFEKTRTSEGDA
jgi:hypothetical protein